MHSISVPSLAEVPKAQAFLVPLSSHKHFLTLAAGRLGQPFLAPRVCLAEQQDCTSVISAGPGCGDLTSGPQRSSSRPLGAWLQYFLVILALPSG